MGRRRLSVKRICQRVLSSRTCSIGRAITQKKSRTRRALNIADCEECCYPPSISLAASLEEWGVTIEEDGLEGGSSKTVWLWVGCSGGYVLYPLAFAKRTNAIALFIIWVSYSSQTVSVPEGRWISLMAALALVLRHYDFDE